MIYTSQVRVLLGIIIIGCLGMSMTMCGGCVGGGIAGSGGLVTRIFRPPISKSFIVCVARCADSARWNTMTHVCAVGADDLPASSSSSPWSLLAATLVRSGSMRND